MTKTEAIKAGIARIKGQDVAPGTVVATEADDITHTFLRYEGDDAVVESVDGEIKKWPRSEVIDANKLMNVATYYYNLGGWEEGMESTIVTL